MPEPPREDAGGSVAACIGGAAGAENGVLDRQGEDAINRRVFETSLDLILVVDRHGTFIRVSPSVAAILGYEPAEMVGRGAAGYVYPDDLDSTRSEMRAARRNRVTRNFECRYVHKEGRVVRLWWTGVWSDPEQQYFFIGRDVTERSEIQRRIGESAARLALAIEISEIGLATAAAPTAPARTDTQFNRIYGLGDRAEIGAGDWLRLIHPDDRDRVAAGVLGVIREGGLYRGEFRIRRADTGEERWLRAATQTIEDEDGAGGGFVGAHLDITDLRSAQHQLQQAQKMEAIGNLTGGMAHDFNNLLGVIIGNLDLLNDRTRLDPAEREMLRDALEAAARGADLTRRLLAFARRQPLQPRLIAVNDLVAGIVALLGRTLGEHIRISLNLADSAWPVRVDPAQLEAALVNLANNARDAMPNGGHLTFATANRHLDADYAAAHAEVTPGDYAAIEVTDTGAGMEPDIAEHVFEPFFTTKAPGQGTGLGLSMVFGFVKQSGGHINVYSELGAGTTFRLYLPREAAAAASDRAETAATAAVSGGGETVLVVEDNEAMRRIVTRQLAELGYRVIEADGAKAALDLLEREPVGLLFSDVVMPGEMNGIALAQAAVARWPRLKVVLTSGFPDTRLGGNGDAVGGIRLLSKPYRRAELAAALRAALDAAAARH